MNTNLGLVASATTNSEADFTYIKYLLAIASHLSARYQADWRYLSVNRVSQLQSLRGMVDLLPDQTRRWQAVEELVRNHFLRAGIEEIRTPLLEPTDLFARGIGEATDVVGKEMYSFLDR